MFRVQSEAEWTAATSEADGNRFENAFVEIPHPFRNGDFVKVLHNHALKNEVCIVECIGEDGEYSACGQRSFIHRDYSDASLRVAYIYGAARFGHAHPEIVDIVWAAPDEDDPKYRLLNCARDLMRGKGGLSDFQLECEAYGYIRSAKKVKP